jgi:cytochrome c biogenesis protein CcmG/thiol:disulfide interchange protein DsbE
MARRFVSLFLLIGLIWALTATINDTQRDASNKVKRQQTASKVEELPKVNFKAPTFSLKGLDGKTHSLEEMKGTPIVINFWASWCTPCKIEAPELVKLYDKYKGRVEIYAVNLTDNDTLKNVKAFAEHYKFDFPVLLDEEGEVSSKYRVAAIPTTYFIDKDGIIVDQLVGFGGIEVFAEKIDNLASY